MNEVQPGDPEHEQALTLLRHSRDPEVPFSMREAEIVMDVANALRKARTDAEVTTSDLIEILGETAWGIDLPALFVYGPVTKPDGTLGTSPVPTALPPEAAKQLVEHIYRRVKKNRGWLREERQKSAELAHALRSIVEGCVEERPGFRVVSYTLIDEARAVLDAHT